MARRRRARRGSWKPRQSGSKAQGCFSLERLEHRQLLTATGYEQINLVSDQSGSALLVDPKLINPYGIAIGSGASDFWVADAGSNSLTRYNGAVSSSAFNQSAISISTTPNGGTGPTGLVSNPTSSFVVDIGNNQNAPAPFIFATRNGQLGLVKTLADTQASAGNNPASGTFYTGLALVTNNSVNNLYATNFAAGTIVKFGTDFSATTAGSAFQDATLTGAGYAPYNIQVLSVNGTPLVFVTYAKQDSVNRQNIASDTHGAIDVFGLDGTLKAQLIGTSDTHLNAPWGLAIAPNNYGDLSGDLLVANGDGTIQAYSLSNVSSTPAATYVDALKNSSGAAIQIDGLHGLAFGNATSAGDANKLYFSAGGGSGTHGLFGELVSATNAISAQGTNFTATEGTAFNGVVAAFTPQAGMAGDTFTATINWGDGSSSTGTIASNGSGGFLVSGSHTYAIDGNITPITVTISDSTTSGNTATATLSAVVIDNDLTATAVPVSATEGAAFNNVPVAIFTDPSINATQGGFTASINWGDGTSSTSGQVIGTNGTFTVQGSHTYATQGAVSGLIITISEGAATPTPITITGSATVADADTLSATATPISTTEGATFSGQVATFTDSYTVTPASSFTATINWGDGFSSVVTPTGANGQFTVSGTHVFSDESSPNVTVTIVETGSGATASASASATASVAEGDTFTPSGVTIDATAGSSFTGVVAKFTDSLTTTPSQDLSATIDWGDGTTTDAGVVNGTNGTFTVNGTHTYASFGGPHTVTVVLHENSPGAASATATSTAFALDSNLTGTPTTVSATEGVAIATGTTVATFTDANTSAVSGDFTATIDWGDGTSSSGGLVTGGSGTFTVSGGHTYAHSGNFTVRVTVFETATPSAQAAVVASSAAISGAPVQVTASPIGATEGSSATFTNLATFTIADTALLSSDFTATIDWGDGHTSQGKVTGAAGSFTVAGTHLYLDEAPGTNALTMKVTISENTPLGTTASATASATVAEGDIFPNGSTTAGLSTQEGVVYNGPVATFNDSNTNADPNGFTAVITWGDGSVTDGTVTGTNGHLTVSGSHTYADDGFYTQLRVDLVDKGPGTAQAVATGTATVSEDSGFSITPVAITGTEGQTLTGVTVATFTDVGSSQPASHYSATIDWGDGSATTNGTATGSNGTFTVTGTHAYADEGPFHPIITIKESNSPATISATGTATMADADVLTATGTTISPTTGATFTGTVATFTDAFLGATKDNFTITIDWGDGTSASSGSVTGSNGTFTVTGSHVYASAGNDTIKVTIKDTDGTASATATSTAQAANKASISGRVFNDVNVNGKLDTGEAGLAGRTVFLNIDGSGVPDSNNPSTTTDANGNFTFSGLAAGNYTVMEVIAANHGVNLTTKVKAVSVAGGQAVTGVNLGNALTSTLLPIPISTDGPIGSSDPNTAYINAVYQNILGHAPDSAGLAHWQQLMASGTSRSAVAQGVWDSTEHRGMIVEGFYHTFLGRGSDPQGKAFWIAAFDSWGAEQIEAAGFVTSTEYLTLHSGHANFVNSLYNDIALRPADSAGASQWVSKLDGGEDPVQVAFAFIYGQEASTALVDSMYSNFLHRAPDSASLHDWVGKLSSKTLTAEQVGVQILATDEFFTNVSNARAPAITSAASTVFTAGSAGSFTVKTSGSPNATLAESGALPSGMTFVDNGNGTATLAGTPAAGASATYTLTITATNGISPSASQTFTLTVNAAPTITSAASASFTVASAGSFTVATSGLPKAALAETGALPSGVTFVDNGNGTATLAGTPAAGTSSAYTLTITATNGISPAASQTFTLTVKAPPAIASAASATFTESSAGSFTVSTSGLPKAALTKTGSLPSGVTFVDNGDGTATLAGTPAAGTHATYTLTITANNGVSPNATQTFTLTVNAAPAITSAANATLTEGSAGSFTVTTSGSPHATLTRTGSLPGGVTFVDNGDGTATLAGTPAAGTSGTYTLTITAHNGVSPDATQTFTLTVNSAPAITSAANATLTEGSAGSFTVTTSGSPHATLTRTGSLPGGVTFVDNGDGTATLAGTPAAGTSGTYTLTITAHNGVSPDATQTFTLTVNSAPVITSAANTTLIEGSAGSFTVTTSGSPHATLTRTGSLPGGVTFVDNGDGTATLAGTPAAGTSGTYTLTITAHNGVSPDATQTFTLTVNSAPAITSAASATFVAGTAATFDVTTSGLPTAAISTADSLPSGVTLTDNGNGTATLAMDSSTAAGVYTFTIDAANGVTPDAHQSFTLTVNAAPAFTSADNTTFVAGTAQTFAVTASGLPIAAISTADSLPPGVTLTDNGNGTATLAMDSSTAAGVYTFTIKAANGVSPDASQSFTLTVNP